ncbi:hypothetical protein TNCV_968781 [Trichonephila clavipes]|nr:hypothetical protein TNCV_968781 [Trichonephila clavipes]
MPVKLRRRVSGPADRVGGRKETVGEGDGKPVPTSRRRPPKRSYLRVIARVFLDESGDDCSHGGSDGVT